MTELREPSPFGEAAPELRALGYTPLPAVPAAANHTGRGKAPGEYSMGRWHGMAKWQRFRDMAPTKFEADLWDRYPDANVGVVLGTKVGDLHLIAIDVDAEDPDELRDILGALPFSPMEKRGKKGSTRFYLASQEIRSTPYDGPNGRLVDVLTGFDCRQTILPPSRHPDGPVYHWLAGPVAAMDLPEFDAADLGALEETLATLGWVPKAERRPTSAAPTKIGEVVTTHDADDIWSETKIAALANLEAWVHDLDVYDLRAARGGYEAVATWRASSTGQPIAARKRNLSIQANGVKDFGTNWTGSAIDLVMEAQGLDQAAATTWLRTRLGLAGEVMVLEHRVKDSTPLPAAPSPREPAELPEALTRVPGLVGRITDWITDTAVSPQRGLALAAALALVGTAAGRKFGGPTYSGTHLYILTLAPTGAGKDHPLSMIGAILDAAGMGELNGPSAFKSDSSVVNTLMRKPLMVCCMDEFGALLRKINGSKAGGHEVAITAILRQAWGASFSSFTSPAYADRDGQRIVAPAMSIVGASTQGEFYAAINGEDVYNGFLNRFLVIATEVNPSPRKPPLDKFEIPPEITAGLATIYNAGGGPLMNATMHGAAANKPAIVLSWADDQAERVYGRLQEDIRSQTDSAELLARTAENALRLAQIRAIGINWPDPRITVEDMEWGRDFALSSAERMIADAGSYVAESAFQSQLNRALRIIEKKGRMSRTEFCKKTQWVDSSRQRDDILRDLEQSGQIVIDEIPGGKPGRPKGWISLAPRTAPGDHHSSAPVLSTSTH
jgi:hypothetical protein